MTIVALIFAYLLGSLSSAILLAKLLKLPDPRSHGSGNAGATNVLRTVGRNKAAAVLIADMLKGVVAVLIARLLHVHGLMLGFVGLLTVIGHVFPVFFRFKGGKGVATMVGTILSLSPFAGILVLVIWLVVAFIFRYSSAASLAAAIMSPLLMLIFGNHAYAFPLFLIALLIIWKHLDNINRLRSGTESKLKL